MKEVWKAVTGYEGLYEVSNLGRIRSLDREVERIDRWSQQITLIKRQGCIMDPYTTLKGGYLRIGLSKNGDQKNHLIHRLVATAFIKNQENKPQINHINCVKTDNNVDNLEWNTNTENYLHSVENGLQHYQNTE